MPVIRVYAFPLTTQVYVGMRPGGGAGRQEVDAFVNILMLKTGRATFHIKKTT